MYKKSAKLFGVIFTALGLLGFVPGITYHGYLFCLFAVNAQLNLFHLISGVIGYWVGRLSTRISKIFIQLAGVVFTTFGLIGFGYGHRPLFGLFANNYADAWLHTLTGIILLYIGFLTKSGKK